MRLPKKSTLGSEIALISAAFTMLFFGIASAGTYVFVNQLKVGASGIEVQNLQKFLTSQGLYSGPITGYFGPLTRAAVIRFQEKYGIETVGQVGPITRAQLNALNGSPTSATILGLQQQITNLQKQLDALTASSATSASILQGLQNQITNLQSGVAGAANNQGAGSPGIGSQSGIAQSSAQAAGQTAQLQNIQSQINAIQDIQNQINSNPNPSLQDIQNQMTALQQIQNQTLLNSPQTSSTQSILNLQNQINSNPNPSLQDIQNQLNALQQIESQMGNSATQP